MPQSSKEEGEDLFDHLIFLFFFFFPLSLFLIPQCVFFLSFFLQINIDPESLKPKLPSRKDLRPYPNSCYLEYRGHTGPVTSLSTERSGQWIASGIFILCVLFNFLELSFVFNMLILHFPFFFFLFPSKVRWINLFVYGKWKLVDALRSGNLMKSLRVWLGILFPTFRF